MIITNVIETDITNVIVKTKMVLVLFYHGINPVQRTCVVEKLDNKASIVSVNFPEIESSLKTDQIFNSGQMNVINCIHTNKFTTNFPFTDNFLIV